MGEWKRIKLSEVLKEKTERNRNNETDLVLSVTNSQGFVKQSDFFEGTVHSEDISNYKLVRKNEFAYNPSRINVGSIDILKEYDIGALSPMYVIFSVDETKLLPDYFKYYFQTHKFNENVKNNTQGSVRNSLSFKALSEFEYLLPPLEEQKRMVKKRFIPVIAENMLTLHLSRGKRPFSCVVYSDVSTVQEMFEDAVKDFGALLKQSKYDVISVYICMIVSFESPDRLINELIYVYKQCKISSVNFFCDFSISNATINAAIAIRDELY